MRIRLTLDLERTPRPAPTAPDEPQDREYVPGAQVEHAGPQRIGFTAQPGGMPTEPEDHRR